MHRCPARHAAPIAVGLFALAGIVAAGSVGHAAPAVEKPRWLKGQTHVHTDRSGDAATPAGDVARWYEAHGYDFVVFTDHNYVTPAVTGTKILTIPGVELTQNLPTCQPPPEPGLQCLLHLNGLFLERGMGRSFNPPPMPGAQRLVVYRGEMTTAQSFGGIAQLNHPNFHYSADATIVTTLAREGLGLLEVANEAVDSNNAGDARHPSTEALWDQVLTAGATVWGIASDDAHHFADAAAVRASGKVAFTGDRGFIMVRARLDAADIRDAVKQGRFYASSGVLLADIVVTPTELRITIDKAARGSHSFTFIGSGGRVLAEKRGRDASFPLASAKGGYVRAVVQDARGKKAWVQPVRVPQS